MKIRFTKAPTFTKAIIAAAVFAIAYLASTSNLPSCSDTIAVLNSGSGECIERQGLLHTASGWLALICLVAAVLLLVLKHKNHIQGWWQESVQQTHQEPQPQAQPQPRHRHSRRHTRRRRCRPRCPGGPRASAPACGTRIIAGDRFCQGCGAQMESHQP